MTLTIRRLCADCQADISERGRSALRCVPCAAAAAARWHVRLRDESRARRAKLRKAVIDWDTVELHWHGGGGAMCGSEKLGDVFALRLGMLTCAGCFRALCYKDVSEYYSRQSVMTDWRDGGYDYDGIGRASRYTDSARRRPFATT